MFSNKSTNQVALNISGSELQMAAQDVDFSFEGNERMNCQYDGEDLQIAFNARFLIEMLNAAETPDVKVELATATKAGLSDRSTALYRSLKKSSCHWRTMPSLWLSKSKIFTGNL